MLNLNWMKLDDKNEKTKDQTNTDTYIAMLMYNIGLLNLKMNLSAGLNYTNMVNKTYTNQLMGATLNVAKTFLQEKLSLNWSNALMLNKINADKGTVFNTALNAAYRFHPKHSVTLNFNMINNSFSNSTTVPSFNEIRGDIGYVFTF